MSRLNRPIPKTVQFDRNTHGIEQFVPRKVSEKATTKGSYASPKGCRKKVPTDEIVSAKVLLEGQATRQLLLKPYQLQLKDTSKVRTLTKVKNTVSANKKHTTTYCGLHTFTNDSPQQRTIKFSL